MKKKSNNARSSRLAVDILAVLPALAQVASAPPKPGTALEVRADQELIRRLNACPLFEDYQQAFRQATGLPLALRSVENWQLAYAGDPHQNSFCALVARDRQGCAGCLLLQQQVCNTANGLPGTLRCAFGLNETAVTVRLGNRTIGYLQTGQVFFTKPTPAQIRRALRLLQTLVPAVNAPAATAAYHATRIVPRQTYASMIRLLEYFAQQLSLLANQLLLQGLGTVLPQVTRARQFIHAHSEEDLSLRSVAQHAGISSFYLCKQFKAATGLNFTDYVSRVRVEKARELLHNPNFRVSEIAYHTGFQSLSHFNRSFKRITGVSPSLSRLPVRAI